MQERFLAKLVRPFCWMVLFESILATTNMTKYLQIKLKTLFMWIIFPEETTPLKRLLNYTKKLRIKFAGGQMMQIWESSFPKPHKMILDQKRILGVLWDEIEGTLIFFFKGIVELPETLSATKRIILKIWAMFFDPVGILQALVFKILFQKVFNWDKVISEELKEE